MSLVEQLCWQGIVPLSGKPASLAQSSTAGPLHSVPLQNIRYIIRMLVYKPKVCHVPGSSPFFPFTIGLPSLSFLMSSTFLLATAALSSSILPLPFSAADGAPFSLDIATDSWEEVLYVNNYETGETENRSR